MCPRNIPSERNRLAIRDTVCTGEFDFASASAFFAPLFPVTYIVASRRVRRRQNSPLPPAVSRITRTHVRREEEKRRRRRRRGEEFPRFFFSSATRLYVFFASRRALHYPLYRARSRVESKPIGSRGGGGKGAGRPAEPFYIKSATTRRPCAISR